MAQPRDPNEIPSGTEFSWGKGNVPELSTGYEPTNFEIMQAIRRTNPADPNAELVIR